MTEHQEQIDRVKAQIEDSTQKADFYLTGLTKRVEEYEKQHENFEPAGQYLKSALDASRAATQKLKTDGKDLSDKSVPTALDGLQRVRESLDSLKQQAITYDDKYAGSKGQHAMETVHGLVNAGRQHTTEALEMASDQLTKLREAVENMASQAAHGTQVAVGEAARLAEKGDEKLDVSGKASGVVQKVRALDERIGVSATAAKVDAKVTGGLGSKVVSTTMEMVSESVEYLSETLQNAKLAAQQSSKAQHVESKAAAAEEKGTEVVETFVDMCEEGEAKASDVKEKTEQHVSAAAAKTKGKTKEMGAKATGESEEPSVEGAVQAAKAKGSEASDAAKQKAADMAESAKQATGSAQDTAKETGQQAEGATEEAGQKAKESAKDTAQKAKGAVQEKGQQAKGAAQEGVEKASGHGGGKGKRSGQK